VEGELRHAVGPWKQQGGRSHDHQGGKKGNTKARADQGEELPRPGRSKRGEFSEERRGKVTMGDPRKNDEKEGIVTHTLPVVKKTTSRQRGGLEEEGQTLIPRALGQDREEDEVVPHSSSEGYEDRPVEGLG